MYHEEGICCGTCRWYGYDTLPPGVFRDPEDDEWFCENAISEYYDEYTDCDDTCDCWKERE